LAFIGVSVAVKTAQVGWASLMRSQQGFTGVEQDEARKTGVLRVPFFSEKLQDAAGSPQSWFSDASPHLETTMRTRWMIIVLAVALLAPHAALSCRRLTLEPDPSH
jgi:hypothetical protein